MGSKNQKIQKIEKILIPNKNNHYDTEGKRFLIYFLFNIIFILFCFVTQKVMYDFLNQHRHKIRAHLKLMCAACSCVHFLHSHSFNCQNNLVSSIIIIFQLLKLSHREFQ